MKKVYLYGFSILIILYGTIIYFKNSFMAEDNSTYLKTVKYEADIRQQPYSPNSVPVPNFGNAPLTEIVVDGEDLKSADKSNLIGSSNPYNQSYVTEVDIVESINRILKKKDMTIDSFSGDYRQYLINLRHIEMVEKISETQSNILRVAEEYLSMDSY